MKTFTNGQKFHQCFRVQNQLRKISHFLYINNKNIEKEIIHIPIHNSLRVNKISWIKPNKEVKNLYHKLNKEIEKDIKKNGMKKKKKGMETHSMLMAW